MKRPNKLARAMMDVEQQSIWADCYRLQVATNILDYTFGLLATGRNGTPVGQRNCTDRPNINSNERCIYCIHSEQNAINWAAKNGVSIIGAQLFTLYRPCLACSNSIVQIRLSAIYYRWDYDTDGQRDYVFNMYENAGIYVAKLEMTPEEITFSKMLKDWRATWT